MTSKVLVLENCTRCWHRRWGVCKHPEMNGEICPEEGFVEGCPLKTPEELYESIKTIKYYEDTRW